jgi:hypothetical protein
MCLSWKKLNMKKTGTPWIVFLLVAILAACHPGNREPANEWLERGFLAPPREFRPETWFHINGNNISREGLTRDLEAIRYAGIRGIQLFNKSGPDYPGVTPVRILSPEWEALIGHAASECKRLGLDFTMQNCPGWSQAGGPWVPVEEAQRELVQSVTRLEGGMHFEGIIPVNEEYLGEDFDYKDVCLMAFTTPRDDALAPFVPVSITSNNTNVPWERIFDPQKNPRLSSSDFQGLVDAHPELTIGKVDGLDTWVRVRFDRPVTLRSIQLPPIRTMVVDRQYPRVDIRLAIQAVDGNDLQTVAEIPVPHTCWPDRQYPLTLALPEITTRELRITFGGQHRLYLAHLFFQGQARIHNWEAKAAFAMRSLEQGIIPAYDPDCFLDPASVLDLTRRMDGSGHLDWEVPEGEWTLVRFGHVNMRETNGPAVPEATGWECSKLDKMALENHLRKGMIGRLIKPGGAVGPGRLDGLLIDSWERMVPTWTMDSETMFKEFLNKRGYDMRPFLPAMMGYVIRDQAYTEKFLRDLRETMDDLFVENFFTHFRTVAHEFGTIVYTEGATGEVLPGDPLRHYGVSDVPMTEFWYPRPPSAQSLDGKPAAYAASAAHLYDKKKVAAEACTQIGVRWDEHPYSVKYLIDKHFTLGINHLVFHTFSHTPQAEVYPGSSFGGLIGFPLVRNQTWWQHLPSWIDYLTRCQYMLQQGEFVADVLWYLGDELERPPFQTTAFPEGYKYDLLNPEILHTKLTVYDGRIRVADGGEYGLIMLRNSKRMLRSTAEKLRELVMAGAVLLGDRPQASPSLTDGPEDAGVLKEIAGELWGEGPSGMKQTGRGRVYWGMPLEEVLNAEAIEKDVVVPEGIEILWIHRRVEDADIYFLSSQSEHAVDASLGFRVVGKNPGLFDPYTGARREAGVWQEAEERTLVAISFEPYGSAIVVFRNGSNRGSWVRVERNGEVLLDSSPGWYRMHAAEEPAQACLVSPDSLSAMEPGEYRLTGQGGKEKTVSMKVWNQPLNENWQLAFEEGWDTPDTIQLPKLASLAENENPAVRYYSGTVHYRKDVQLPSTEGKILLDLGDVENIAAVWCNGRKAGTRWSPPFIFELTGLAGEGMNELEIRVTNTWRNQLIYDLQRPESDRRTWTTNPPDDREEPPAPAGLIGPVVISEGKAARIIRGI